MSHSLIIHVSSSLVLENERITADNLCFDTIQVEIPLMDYFKDSDSLREDDLKWIGAELAKVGFKLNREEITMTVDTSFIDKWKDATAKAADEFDLWKMKKVANGTAFSSMYVYEEENGYPKPLWEWAYDYHTLGKGEVKLYVGGIIDYHF
ncbi:hypothetical protein [Bacteroides pyogenes]|uniref:hypothetical protein n=1 Tax=Bacteroides pyogenes TaxID=310300 RepID=UPI002FD94C9A